MKTSLILALLAVSFVVALSSPSELTFKDKMKQFHERMHEHLNQEPRHKIPAWKVKRMNLQHADYEPSEERVHHGGLRHGGENSYERRAQYNHQGEASPSLSGRRYFSPNAEMHNNRFSRPNSELNQIEQNREESLDVKIERMEKKLLELKRIQKYQEALQRVMERLAKKKAERSQ